MEWSKNTFLSLKNGRSDNIFICKHIKLPTKLLDYFLKSNKIKSINCETRGARAHAPLRCVCSLPPGMASWGFFFPRRPNLSRFSKMCVFSPFNLLPSVPVSKILWEKSEKTRVPKTTQRLYGTSVPDLPHIRHDNTSGEQLNHYILDTTEHM